MRSPWRIWVGPKPNGSVLIRGRREIPRGQAREEGAEAARTLPQGTPQPPDPGRGRGRQGFPGASREANAMTTP